MGALSFCISVLSQNLATVAAVAFTPSTPARPHSCVAFVANFFYTSAEVHPTQTSSASRCTLEALIKVVVSLLLAEAMSLSPTDIESVSTALLSLRTLALHCTDSLVGRLEANAASATSHITAAASNLVGDVQQIALELVHKTRRHMRAISKQLEMKGDEFDDVIDILELFLQQ